jgi:sugar transferase (PEP-CTERM/EpsH1 system associated)
MSTGVAKPRILYIAHRVPYPPNKGDKIRSYNILRHLAERFDTSLATLIDDANDIQWLPKLESETDRVVYARIDQKGRKLLSARALLEGRSISQRFFHSQTLQDRIDNLLDAQPFDVILCSSSPMAEYLFQSRHFDRDFDGARRVIDLIDVDSHKWHQYAETAGPLKSWVYKQEARHLGNFERRIYEYFDKLVLVSDQEKQYFPGGDKASKIIGVPNGVDLEYFHPKHSSRDPDQPPTLVFCGMMDYWPNIEGVMWFVEKVFDKVRTAVPDVRFLVVGGRPTRQVLELNSIPGVTVTGFVEDVRDYTGTADVCVVPLRIARGIQNKVLEAMAMQKAIVSTPQALEGILATPQEDLAVEEDPEQFAARTIQLLRDREMNDRLARNARACVEASYVWSKNLSTLDQLLLVR